MDTEEEWEVEKLVDKKTFKGHTQYLVHWVGYLASERQWLDLVDLENCKDLVEDFEDTLPLVHRLS